MKPTRIKEPASDPPRGPSLEGLCRLARKLAWTVLAGAVLLALAAQLREYPGYQVSDSQLGLFGLVSLVGFILVFFLALFQLVVVTLGLILAQQQHDQMRGRELWVALAINLAGLILFLFL